METEHASGTEGFAPHLDPMKSWNWISITGCLGKNADHRFTQSGKPVTALSIAQSDKDKTGKVLGTHWFEITAWGDLAERSANFHKGQWVTVRGSLKTRQWKTKAGQEIKSTYILARDIFATKFDTERKRPSTSTYESGHSSSEMGPEETYSGSVPHWTPPAQDDVNSDIPF